MSDDLNIPEGVAFYLQKRKIGNIPSFEEEERKLLLDFTEREASYQDGLYKLAWFYSTSGQPVKALTYMQKLSDITDDPEIKTRCYLSKGQLMESMCDYENAVTFYSQAFSLKATNSDDWYLINNNLGYCLNQLGRHKEADKYCRAAIEINSARHNAYKNLGISCAGTGNYQAAVENFVRATRANASDPRALAHLEELIEQHPELLTQVPDLLLELDNCRQAVNTIREMTKRAIDQENTEP
ncbi:MAG: tetratricopeptide repeat protein [Nitrospirae bacterium]|nr:tetratricopeptide repeat protein [Nitrospirota bacterium]